MSGETRCIPYTLPASELALYTTYDSTIKKEGSDNLGGRSMVLDLELL